MPKRIGQYFGMIGRNIWRDIERIPTLFSKNIKEEKQPKQVHHFHPHLSKEKLAEISRRSHRLFRLLENAKKIPDPEERAIAIRTIENRLAAIQVEMKFKAPHAKKPIAALNPPKAGK